MIDDPGIPASWRAFVSARTGREAHSIINVERPDSDDVVAVTIEAGALDALAEIMAVDPTVHHLRDISTRTLHGADRHTRSLSREALTVALAAFPRVNSYVARTAMIGALGSQPHSDLVVPAFLNYYWTVVPEDDPMGLGDRENVVMTLEAYHKKHVPYEEWARIVATPNQGVSASHAVWMLANHPKRKAESVPLLVEYLSRADEPYAVLETLRKLKAVETRAVVEKLAASDDPGVRKAALKTLATFDKLISQD